MEYYVAAEAIRAGGWILSFTALASVFAIFGGGFLAAYGQGQATSKAVEAVGKNPEARGEVMSTLIVGCALSETNGIYGLLISIILLFVNPLFNAFTAWVATLGF